MVGPRKYYDMLGIPPTADADAIKRAYRKLAFQYHPDRNPSVEAEDTFKRLTEAYEILTGIRKAPASAKAKAQAKTGTTTKPRQSQQSRHGGKAGGATHTGKAKAQSNAYANTQARSTKRPKSNATTAGKTASETKRSQPGFAECVITQKISAQPRYVEFEVVKGFLGRVESRRVGGVMSPQGARKAALRASLTTWLLGFWGWKSWRRAFSAIIGNISGGTRPAASNAKLLYTQARAFEVRGQKDTARAVALQAAAYAGTDLTGDNIRHMMRRLDNNQPVRKLKNEWHSGLGLSAFMQLSPAMVPIFAVLWALLPL